MRVLHIDTGMEMRGGQWQALRLAEGLGAEGCASVLLTPAASPLSRAAEERGIATAPLRPGALVQLSREATLTHAHDARAHTLAAVLARSPVVVARRVAFPIGRGFFSRRKYARAAHFIAVSRYVGGLLAEAGVPPERISVVYDGVPVPASRASGPLIVTPSSGDFQKGTELARRAAKEAGVELTASENLEEDLQRARLFLCITRQEGLGSAILLAMAAGVPVVASRIGGIPEIVEDGATGLMVENEPRDIAAACRRLIEDEPLRASMAARARAAVIERFSTAAMVRGTLSVYQRVLSCSKP